MEVPVKLEPSADAAPPSSDAEKAPEPVTQTSDSTPQQPSGPPPVMDVRPPEATDKPEPPKPREDKQPEAAEPPQKQEQPKAVVPKKPRQPGVGMAIVATVVIVLGLAALITYAYLKTAR